MKPDSIILHHSLTEDGSTLSWQAIRKYHIEENGWRDVGYHFGIELINNQYEVLLGRQLNEVGAHCRGMNSRSVGICFVGNFDESVVPDAQWSLGLKLVRGLIEVIGISKNDIYGHYEFASYKSCPGVNFNVDLFIRDLLTLEL
jgi:N-acetyl-anhydromuramyl-L-alanine amidase AmpD